ncbi:MAG: hypothetical protein WC149_08635 [Arcobacteraceae bacterium]
MVIPLVPVAMAALGGLAGGALLSSIGMGGDEQTEIQRQTDIQTNYSPVSNIVNFNEQSYQYMANSPKALQTTKKESAIRPTAEGNPALALIPTASQSQSTGIKPADFTPLILIAGAAYVASSLLDVKK